MTHIVTEDLEICKEDKLLLLCAKTFINDMIKLEIRSIASQEIDWDYLFNKSYKHRLSPVLYKQLHLICPDCVPLRIMDSLRKFFHENGLKNLLFLGELIKILDFLESHHIDVIAYKGPVLAIQAYQDIALRQFDDLDIFIHQNDVIKVISLLTDLGYHAKVNVKKSQEKVFLRSQREFKFYNPFNKITLEVHWKLIASSFSFSKNKHFLRNPCKFKTINIKGQNFRTFSPEDMIMIICFHAAGNPWARLSWLCDIAKIIETEDIEWDKLIEETTQAGAKRVLLINLILVNELLGLTLPEKVFIEILLDKTLFKLSNNIKKNFFGVKTSNNIFSRAKLRLGVREQIIDKFKDFIKVLLQPTARELQIINLPLILYPIYYLIRLWVVLSDKKKIN